MLNAGRILELLLCQTPACIADHGAKRQKAIAEYQDALTAMEPLIIPEERAHYQEFMESIKAYQDASDRGIGLLAAGKTADALDLLSSDAVMKSLADALSAADFGFLGYANLGMDKAGAATVVSIRATWVCIGVTLLIVLLCALTGYLLTRVIAPRLVSLRTTVERWRPKI